ncbi:hypothetical protein [Allorhizocola rhizosphaerae]|uniref:hypothetical protein n=1 Tax=Allorhizocola rhizosphaerae TaxID=1872709 RepID=UPI001B8D45E7|nr:hypothetical protein [Allorhizocola rhizosphaerae]
MTTIDALPRTPSGLIRLARSGPWDSVRPAVVVAVYRLWLVAFALKMLGSTWDMSWHFKWLRDTAAPPHIINTIGTVIVVALVIYQARFDVGVDAWAKRLMVFGTGMFLIAIPIDVINHEINGLDITAWSPSHILLYLGTAFMLLGCFRGFWSSTEPSRTRTIIGAVLWGFFLENVLFPSQHQEYGQLSLEAWLAGSPTAEPMLLEFAAGQLGRPVDDIAVQGFALPVDSWVYPMWIVSAAILTLVAARRFVGARWTATAIAAGYIGYRLVAWILLTGTGFPPSLPPLMLLAGAIMVDLAFLAIANGYARAIGGALLATGATAAAAWVQDYSIGAPPIDYVAFAWGGIFLAVAWAGLSVGQRTPALTSAPATAHPTPAPEAAA